MQHKSSDGCAWGRRAPPSLGPAVWRLVGVVGRDAGTGTRWHRWRQGMRQGARAIDDRQAPLPC